MPRHVLTLVPCHSLEDFPVHWSGPDAHSLLSALVCGWHPQLLAAAERIPGWCRLDSPPENCQDLVLLVPSGSERGVPTGLPDRVRQQQGEVIRGITGREGAANQIGRAWNISIPAAATPLPADGDAPDPNDFFALGYVYWQVLLMTRQLRYGSQLDESFLQSHVVAAAHAWTAGESTSCHEHLQAAFDLVAQERSRYFPIEPQFIDLILVATTTLGAEFVTELSTPRQQSVLLSGDLVRTMARDNSQALAQLQSRAAAGSLELVGGMLHELPWGCVEPATIDRQFREGLAQFQQHLESRPRVFAQRTLGLTSFAPQFLCGWGYRAAIHGSFDGGELPQGNHSPVEWSAGDGHHLPAWLGTPLDAANPGSFLRLGIAIGEALDSAHTSASLFAHWPGQVCEWFADLRRAARYGRALGEFTPLLRYCQQGSFSGQRVQFEPGEYRNDLLRRWQMQKFQDPLSRWIAAAQWQARLREQAWLAAMSELSGLGAIQPDGVADRSAVDSAQSDSRLAGEKIGGGTPAEIAGMLGSAVSPRIRIERAAEEIEKWNAGAAERLAAGLAGPIAGGGPALVVLNPSPQPRRIVCQIPAGFGWLEDSPAVVASEVTPAAGGPALLELPPAGYVVVVPRPTAPRGRRRSSPKVVADLTLRNEFFEVAIDERSGGVRGITLFERRGNLLSQQLAMRLAVPRPSTPEGGDSLYSLARVRAVETLQNNSLVGQIRTKGELLAGEEPLASFAQTVTVHRGRRTIELDVELDLHKLPGNDPWRQYYCCRFAWADESATLSGSVLEHRSPLVGSQLESPRYVEIAGGAARIAILGGGLLCHRRYDYRKLDSLLVVAEESARRFRLGIAVNADFPGRAAHDFEQPSRPTLVERTQPAAREREGAGGQPAAWLARVSSRNVWISGVAPWRSAAGEESGLELQLCETEGRGGQAELETARPLRSAARVNLNGDELSQLPLRDGRVQFGFGSHEYFQIRCVWH